MVVSVRPGVATMKRNRRPVSCGTGGWNESEWPAELKRNQWPNGAGIRTSSILACPHPRRVEGSPASVPFSRVLSPRVRSGLPQNTRFSQLMLPPSQRCAGRVRYQQMR